MSTEDFKPGTVAVATVRGVPNVRVFRYSMLAWVMSEPVSALNFHPNQDVTGVRPLVVIDPEDREQVERLTGALVYSGAGKNDDNHWREVQAALREFADPKPPRSEEPTGLGAVVVDTEGVDWHRTRDGRWIAADDLRTKAGGWGHIAAVHVLSEGV